MKNVAYMMKLEGRQHLGDNTALCVPLLLHPTGVGVYCMMLVLLHIRLLGDIITEVRYLLWKRLRSRRLTNTLSPESPTGLPASQALGVIHSHQVSNR